MPRAHSLVPLLPRLSTLALAILLLPGCFLFISDDDDDDFDPPDPDEPALTYSPANVTLMATIGTSALVPALVDWFDPVVYDVSPDLPAGMQLAAATGAISGPPDAVQAATAYTVTATEDPSTGTAGAFVASTTLTITVIEPEAPTSLSYPLDPALYFTGQPVSPNLPVVDGVISTFEVVPELPDGLGIGVGTGIISGAPTQEQLPTTYTITGSNPYGFVQTTLTIEVAPSSDTRALWVSHADGALTTARRISVIGRLLPRDVDALPCSPTALAPAPHGRFVFATCPGGDIHRVDVHPVTGQAVASSLVGSVFGATDAVVDPMGSRLFVLGSGTLTRFDVDAEGELCCAVSAPVPDDTFAMTLHPSGELLFVPSGGGGGVLTFSVAAGLVPVAGLTPVDGYPVGIAFDKSGDHGYVWTAIAGTIAQFRATAPAAVAAGALPLIPLDPPTVSLGASVTDVAVRKDTLLLAAVAGQDQLHQLTIGSGTGLLTPHPAGPVSIPGPLRVLVEPRFGSTGYVLSSEEQVWALRVATTGGFEPVQRSRTRAQPAELALIPGPLVYERSKWVFTVSTVDDAIIVAELDYVGELVPTAQGPVPTSDGPVDVVVDRRREHVYVANRDGGSISVYDFDAATGVLTPGTPPALSLGGQPVQLALDPGQRFLLVADATGSVRSLAVSAFDGSLAPITTFALDPAPTSLAVDPLGDWVWGVHAASGTVRALRLDPVTGLLFGGATTALGGSADALVIDPSGRHGYVADPEFGAVRMLQVGDLGALTPVQAPVPAGAGTSALAVHPHGWELYAANTLSDDISIYDRDQLSGLLTERVSVSPQAVKDAPAELHIDAFDRYMITVSEGAPAPELTLSSIVSGALPGGLTEFDAWVPATAGPYAIAVDVVSNN